MSDTPYQRLSDHILEALKLAIEQKDIAIADLLVDALDLSMTRNAGGGSFVERRNFPAELDEQLAKLRTLKQS
jgi:hypothetical protein